MSNRTTVMEALGDVLCSYQDTETNYFMESEEITNESIDEIVSKLKTYNSMIRIAVLRIVEETEQLNYTEEQLHEMLKTMAEEMYPDNA